MTIEQLARLLAVRDRPFTRWGELKGFEQEDYRKLANRLLAYGAQHDHELAALLENVKAANRKKAQDAAR